MARGFRVGCNIYTKRVRHLAELFIAPFWWASCCWTVDQVLVAVKKPLYQWLVRRT